MPTPTAPAHDPYRLARRSAAAALLVVVAEAGVASLFSIVPALSPVGGTWVPASSPWVGLAAPLVAAIVAATVLTALLASPAPRALPFFISAVAAVALGASVAGFAVLSSSLRGIGLAFAAPLVVGEILACAAWISGGVAERASTGLSLAAAALTTVAAAFFAERIDLGAQAGPAPLALAVGGVLAQLQLAAARVGEARAALDGANDPRIDVWGVAAARIGGVPRVLLLAALGRSGSQENV